MESKAIQLICSDIDGTLLDRHRGLSEETVRTVQALRVPFILVSARMPRAMRYLQRELGLEHLPLIAYNGGLILRFREGEPETLQSTFIPNEVSEVVIERGRGSGLHFGLFSGDEWAVNLSDEWTAREVRNTRTEPDRLGLQGVTEAWEARGTGAHKIMIMGDAQQIGRLELELQADWSEELHIYRSKSTYLELAARSISKASAIEFLARKEFGVKMSEVMAFGDNFNDVEMLRKVGLGVAVANAVEPALKAADATTLGHKEHGVAHFLQQYFELGG